MRSVQVDFMALRDRLEATAKASGAVHAAFSIEAVMRLEQLHWLCKQISEAEANALTLAHERSVKAKITDKEREAVLALQTLTEAFYYMAWRFISAVDRKESPLPFLKGLRAQCTGIRMVRNHLIEHPEGAESGVHVPAIMFGSPKGPQLKFVAELATDEEGKTKFKTNKEHLLDPGLWPNAEQLWNAIDRKLSVAGDA